MLCGLIAKSRNKEQRTKRKDGKITNRNTIAKRETSKARKIK